MATQELGYEDLWEEFPKDFRGNKRVMAKSKRFAQEIWLRLKSVLQMTDVTDVRPYGFDNGGVWKASGVNECLRFCWYQEGDQFKPHRDGCFVLGEDNRSVFTIMVYLSDTFTGGETQFLDRLPTKGKYSKNSKKILSTFKPQRGTALVFTQDTPHAGLPVLSGHKFILRTDVMFTRVARDWAIPYLAANLVYQQTMKLLDESEREEKTGNLEKATDLWQSALEKMSLHSPSIISTNNNNADNYSVFAVLEDDKNNPKNVFLPEDIIVLIFSRLDTSCIVKDCMRVSRSWYNLSRSSRLWRSIFGLRYPLSLLWEEEIESNSNSNSNNNNKQTDDDTITFKDWFSICKQRLISESTLPPVVIDMGTHYTRVGRSSSNIPVQLESFVHVLHPHSVAAGRGLLSNVVVGTPASLSDRQAWVVTKYPFSSYAGGISSAEIGGCCIIDWETVKNVLHWLFQQELKTDASDQPVVLTVPLFTPEMTTRGQRDKEMLQAEYFAERLGRLLFEDFNSPAVSFIPQPLALLKAAQRHTGLVVLLGGGKSQIVPIVNEKIIWSGVKLLTVTGDVMIRDIFHKTTSWDYQQNIVKVHSMLQNATVITTLDESLEQIKKKMRTSWKASNEQAAQMDPHSSFDTNLAPQINVDIFTEALFDPSLISLTGPGVVDAVIESVNACEASLRQQLWGNIILAGGLCYFEGFEERFHLELKSKLKNVLNSNIQITRQDVNAVWCGACVQAQLSDFRSHLVTVDQWQSGQGVQLLKKMMMPNLN